MIYDLYFYYRFEKGSGFAKDANGDPSEAYIRVLFGDCNTEARDIEREQKDQADMAVAIAAAFNIKAEFITPVSKEEYEANTEPEEDA